jgi:hypothetical protein
MGATRSAIGDSCADGCAECRAPSWHGVSSAGLGLGVGVGREISSCGSARRWSARRRCSNQRLHALLPLAAPIDPGAAQPDPRAQVEQALWRDPRLRQPADHQQLAADAWRRRGRSGRFLVPRRAAVSAGSARCTRAPIAWNSSTTTRQPVVASNQLSIPLLSVTRAAVSPAQRDTSDPERHRVGLLGALAPTLGKCDPQDRSTDRLLRANSP